MGPRGTPQKSIFWSQKWYFSDFLFRGSVEGRGGRKARTERKVGRKVCWANLRFAALTALQKHCVKMFSSNLPGNFALKNGGDFW